MSASEKPPPPSFVGALLRAVAACLSFVLCLQFGAELVVRLLGEEVRSGFLPQMGGMAVACCALLMLFRLAPPRLRVGPLRVSDALFCYGLFLLFWLTVTFLYMRALSAMGLSTPPQELVAEMASASLFEPETWALLLGIVLVGPLTEEILFRGYLQDLGVAALGQRRGELCIAALFGLMHGPLYALPIGLLGYFLGFLRREHGSLLSPFLAHAAHNLFNVGSVLCWPQALDFLYAR